MNINKCSPFFKKRVTFFHWNELGAHTWFLEKYGIMADGGFSFNQKRDPHFTATTKTKHHYDSCSSWRLYWNINRQLNLDIIWHLFFSFFLFQERCLLVCCGRLYLTLPHPVDCEEAPSIILSTASCAFDGVCGDWGAGQATLRGGAGVCAVFSEPEVLGVSCSTTLLPWKRIRELPAIPAVLENARVQQVHPLSPRPRLPRLAAVTRVSTFSHADWCRRLHCAAAAFPLAFLEEELRLQWRVHRTTQTEKTRSGRGVMAAKSVSEWATDFAPPSNDESIKK